MADITNKTVNLTEWEAATMEQRAEWIQQGYAFDAASATAVEEMDLVTRPDKYKGLERQEMARKNPLVKPYSIYFVTDAMGRRISVGNRSLMETKKRLEIISALNSNEVLASGIATPPFRVTRIIVP